MNTTPPSPLQFTIGEAEKARLIAASLCDYLRADADLPMEWVHAARRIQYACEDLISTVFATPAN